MNKHLLNKNKNSQGAVFALGKLVLAVRTAAPQKQAYFGRNIMKN